MTRTDTHSESCLDPEDYQEITYIVLYNGANDWPLDPSEVEHRRFWLDKLRKEGSSVHGPNQCGHCGAYLRYAVILEHMPTGTFLPVGTTCAETRFGMDLAGWKAFKQQMDNRRAQAAELGKLEAWKGESADNREAADWLNSGEIDSIAGQTYAFLSDIRHKLNRYKELSERQVAAVLKIRAKQDEIQTARAAEAATRAPAPSGKGIVIEGEVVGTQFKENYYTGGQDLKLTIKSDEGYVCWGSCPATWTGPDGELVTDDTHEFEEDLLGFKGQRVRLVANLEPSQDDPTFAFYKRPRKAEFLESILRFVDGEQGDLPDPVDA